MLATVFIVSGITKLIEIRAFALVVGKFEILPIFVIPYFTILLPIVELLLGLSILFRFYIIVALKWLFMLICVFNLVIIITMLRGIAVNCGCFGELFDNMAGLEALVRNIFLLGLLTLLLKNKSKYVN